ncbi:hypothetical protein [Nostoc sp. CCY 9925]|uniref:hypothetical protein n=1 Tax=Nostoc sp. CCY 9925 TaxID=3103865 RepID=UPI0039C63012
MYRGFDKDKFKNSNINLNGGVTKQQVLDWLDSPELIESFKKALDTGTTEIKILLDIFKNNLAKTKFKKHISLWHETTVIGIDTNKWEFWVHVGMIYGIVKFDDQIITLKSFLDQKLSKVD